MSDHYVVTLDDLLASHAEALRFGGGVEGVKNEGQLLSAIGRPYQEFQGLIPYPGVVDKAGCLLHALLNCHGFNDANKRTAWIVCNAFLYAEGQEIVLADDFAWYDDIALIVEESWDVQEVITWVAERALYIG